jgi:predicted  nucleic acid-binding Zn-ribbon protein
VKLVRYVCTHCGKKFEAEEKDILECPGCFWSTSVRREEDAAQEAESPSTAPKSKFRFSFPGFDFKPVAWAVLAVAVLFLVIRVIAPAISKGAGSFKVSFPQKVLAPAQERQAPAIMAPSVSAPGLEALSPEEKNILAKRLQFLTDRPVSDEEQKVLDARAAFKTGYSEKLPSPAWTLESFKELIKNQEKAYQVPLPGSYKRKLSNLFEEKYLPAAEAFKAGDMIRARNGWVESLAFPVYANDIQKHRGVVLTMLRPLITDTLSKIGFINSALVEKKVRDREADLAVSYEQLIPLLQNRSWDAALEAITALEQKLQAFAYPEKLAGGPSEYPAAIKFVDQDIRVTLFDLLTVPPPAISDLDPLSRDLFAKKRVVEGFLPASLEARQTSYNEGLEAMDRGDWAGAEKKFKEVDLPAELAGDAQKKIEILKKMRAGRLDSGGKTS